jgi:hypothetical protein
MVLACTERRERERVLRLAAAASSRARVVKDTC